MLDAIQTPASTENVHPPMVATPANAMKAGLEQTVPQVRACFGWVL